VATGRPASLLALALLGGCAAWQDAPRLAFQCPRELRFEARLYQDMALLEGLRGHAVLERVADADGTLRYADPTVQARFGLGLDGRLARLDYSPAPRRPPCAPPPAPARARRRRGPTPTRRCRPTSARATATTGRADRPRRDVPCRAMSPRRHLDGTPQFGGGKRKTPWRIAPYT